MGIKTTQLNYTIEFHLTDLLQLLNLQTKFLIYKINIPNIQDISNNHKTDL